MPWLDHKYARPRHQSRRVHDEHAGEPQPRAVLLHRVASRRCFSRCTRWRATARASSRRPTTIRSIPTTIRSSGAKPRLLGGAMALELQRDHRTGVVSNAMYDYYWPGYEDSAPLGHNTVCLLTEVASVRVATPIDGGSADLARRSEGAARVQSADQFSRSVARRVVDAARHRGLRLERGARTAARRVRRTASRSFRTSTTWAVARSRPASGRAVRVRHPARAARSARDGQARGTAAAGQHRNSPRARAVPRRRQALPRGHRHHPAGAAVSRVREDAARAAGLSGAPA